MYFISWFRILLMEKVKWLICLCISWQQQSELCKWSTKTVLGFCVSDGQFSDLSTLVPFMAKIVTIQDVSNFLVHEQFLSHPICTKYELYL